jgi:hypothetical protein
MLNTFGTIENGAFQTGFFHPVVYMAGSSMMRHGLGAVACITHRIKLTNKSYIHG